MNLPQAKVLFFAEDVGAANYVAPLVDFINGMGITILLIAANNAKAYFSKQGLSFIDGLEIPGGAQKIISAVKPKLIIAGTSENKISSGLFLIEEAKKKGIPTIGAIDAFMNSAYRFRGLSSNPLAFAPDWLMLPDKWTKKEYVSLGFPEDHALVCGHPHYDQVSKEKLRLDKIGKEEMVRRLWPSLKPKRKKFIFAAEISNGLVPGEFLKSPEYTLSGRGKEMRRTNIVLEEFLDAVKTLPSAPHIVLRLSPKNSKNEFDDYLSEISWVSYTEPVLDVLYASDLVVGMTSMVLIEAAILDKPVVSIVPRKKEKTWLPLLAEEDMPCLYTRNAIEKFFQSIDTFSNSAFRCLPSCFSKFAFPSQLLSLLS